MTQADGDRLVTLKKAKNKLITQREAAEELGLRPRHVKRLLYAMKKEGDKAVVHGLGGKPSNRKIEAKVEREVSSVRANAGGGVLGEETRARGEPGNGAAVDDAGQTVAGKEGNVKYVRVWRPRRSRLGELVQWDISEHDWLEGRGGSERLYLIAMIDDATSRLFARFVRSDSTEENMRLLWSCLEKFGRPLTFYTDKAVLFQTAEKRKRDEPGVEKDPVEMPPTQSGAQAKFALCRELLRTTGR